MTGSARLRNGLAADAGIVRVLTLLYGTGLDGPLGHLMAVLSDQFHLPGDSGGRTRENRRISPQAPFPTFHAFSL